MAEKRAPRGQSEQSARRILWEPQQKQRVFQARREYEVLYGGAAGGGVEMEGDSISTMEPSLVRAKEHCRTDVEALSKWTRSTSEG